MWTFEDCRMYRALWGEGAGLFQTNKRCNENFLTAKFGYCGIQFMVNFWQKIKAVSQVPNRLWAQIRFWPVRGHKNEIYFLQQPLLLQTPGQLCFQQGQSEPPEKRCWHIMFVISWLVLVWKSWIFTLKSFLCWRISSILIWARSNELGSSMLPKNIIMDYYIPWWLWWLWWTWWLRWTWWSDL